ncbi:hypothetical protein MCBG_04752 [Micromonospora sp. M42]|nr:hypothetical protein MCBG_04752 [Micromonospora sp. M42]
MRSRQDTLQDQVNHLPELGELAAEDRAVPRDLTAVDERRGRPRRAGHRPDPAAEGDASSAWMSAQVRSAAVSQQPQTDCRTWRVLSSIVSVTARTRSSRNRPRVPKKT